MKSGKLYAKRLNLHTSPVKPGKLYANRGVLHTFYYICSMILMGVVNLTPDSFREDTRAMTAAAVRRRVESLLERGCGIIDFGAVSTRPGAAPVPVETEWQRLQPAIDLICLDGRLAAAPETEGIPPVSVDTTSAEIVRRVYGRIGRFIVNDISAGEDDPRMLPTVAE